MILKPALLVLLVAVIALSIVSVARSNYRGVRAGHADADYIDSKKCIACHDDHYQSWARTYHRRMTQDARLGFVQGDFDRANTFDYQGIKARMERRGAEFFMTFTLPDGRVESKRIVRTVGSRRIEQYISEEQGQHTREPLAYDLTNRRWMSLNGSFFHPDGKPYFHLRAPWDPNCVFCHNVKAQPGLDQRSRLFKTEVAELGIACGACHGPGAVHADLAASPFTRARWRLDRRAPREIVNPRRLDPGRSLMVCGHCHGQRIPEPLGRIQDIMTRGDPYNAGDDLSMYYRPIGHGTRVGSYSFAPRFWPNGSPRLTAYEYQGLLRSACFIKAGRSERITCLSCHSMHAGDPKGQITEANRTDKPCLACHRPYEEAAALVAHTGHPAGSSGSRCYTCHMPRVVYGIMSVHPTHEITVPDPRLTYTQHVPNACNQCHLDQSVNWAVRESKRLWPQRFRQARVSADAQFEVSEGARALFAGDALTRALAAEALSTQVGPGRRTTWAGALLAEALKDNYPIVRYFAVGGLARYWPEVRQPDYLDPIACGDAVGRYVVLYEGQLRDRTARMAEMLRKKRTEADVEVGE